MKSEIRLPGHERGGQRAKRVNSSNTAESPGEKDVATYRVEVSQLVRKTKANQHPPTGVKRGGSKTATLVSRMGKDSQQKPDPAREGKKMGTRERKKKEGSQIEVG